MGEPGAEGCGGLGVKWTYTENIPTDVTAGEATRK